MMAAGYAMRRCAAKRPARAGAEMLASCASRYSEAREMRSRALWRLRAMPLPLFFIFDAMRPVFTRQNMHTPC